MAAKELVYAPCGFTRSQPEVASDHGALLKKDFRAVAAAVREVTAAGRTGD